MLTIKHTPFPWQWDVTDLWHRGESYHSEVDPHFYTGIDAHHKLIESPYLQGNMKLIAALPDMLNILTELKDHFDQDYTIYPNQNLHRQVNAVFDKLNGTIKELPTTD